jgi:thymidylate synthase
MNYSIKSLKAKNAADAYSKLIALINKEGDFIESRNEATVEVMNVAVEIENPRDRIINISNFRLPFILQETFDILNSNQPRIIHSKEMLQKTMGNSTDPMFFGNELRQALSRWSLYKIKERFVKDKNTRKAVLSLGNRRNHKHTPCMIYAHFIIRDNKFFMTAETRGTAVSMGFVNDVFVLTLVQEIIYGWLLEVYPDLELGSFLYKTVSLHEYVDVVKSIDAVAALTTTLNNELAGKETNQEDLYDKSYVPTWDQTINEFKNNIIPIKLTYKEYLQDMGVLYHYCDDFMKAALKEDVDEGDITLVSDVQKPQREFFNSEYFYNWANTMYYYTKSADFGEQPYLKVFTEGDLHK